MAGDYILGTRIGEDSETDRCLNANIFECHCMVKSRNVSVYPTFSIIPLFSHALCQFWLLNQSILQGVSWLEFAFLLYKLHTVVRP